MYGTKIIYPETIFSSYYLLKFQKLFNEIIIALAKYKIKYELKKIFAIFDNKLCIDSNFLFYYTQKQII